MESATSSIRQLCYQIQNHFKTVIDKHQSSQQKHTESIVSIENKPPTNKSSALSIYQPLKNGLIQLINAQLPSIIAIEDQLQEKIEELTQEKHQWHQQYKKIYKNYECCQLENDRMKVEVVNVQQSYQDLSKNYEELKYKFYESKRQVEQASNTKHEMILQVGQDLTPKRNNNSPRIQSTQLVQYEKQLFQLELRQSQKQIQSLKHDLKQLSHSSQKLHQQNNELQHLLSGQKHRSDKLDKQILQILGKNQDLKLELLEMKENIIQKNQYIEGLGRDMKQEKRKAEVWLERQKQLQQQFNKVNEKVNNLKEQIVMMKNSLEQSKQNIVRQQHKNNNLNKQNQQIRHQLQKLLTIQVQRQHKYKNQLTQQKQKAIHTKTELKGKTSSKIQQISHMHSSIKQKLEHKIAILEKGNKDYKDRVRIQKAEIQRLYESLQTQVGKEFRNSKKTKDVEEKIIFLESQYSLLQEKEALKDEDLVLSKDQNNILKQSIASKQKQIRKLNNFKNKVISQLIPKITKELSFFRQVSRQISETLSLQQQQVSFLSSTKYEKYILKTCQLFNSKFFTTEKTRLSLESEIEKWKQLSKSYETKYQQLEELNDMISKKESKMETKYSEQLKQRKQQIKNLLKQNEEQKVTHYSLSKNAQILKEKCREAEKYYRLIEQLTHENLTLKSKLDSINVNQFSSSPTIDHEKTNKRVTFCVDSSTQIRKVQTEMDCALNDITTKAQYQKMRLQQVKKEHEILYNN